ncbi:MAG: antitoxin MazE [Bacillota bacterium]|jgi:hypothetical protein
MMKINIWSHESMAEGYREMADINLALAKDFEPLEDEALEEKMQNFINFEQKGE